MSHLWCSSFFEFLSGLGGKKLKIFSEFSASIIAAGSHQRVYRQ